VEDVSTQIKYILKSTFLETEENKNEFKNRVYYLLFIIIFNYLLLFLIIIYYYF
jgi:hypothetical protein